MDSGTLQLIVGGTVVLLVGAVAVRWALWMAKEPRPRPRWGGSRSSPTSLSYWDSWGGDFGSGVGGYDGDTGGDGGGDGGG